jgi:hypothetical protein
MAALTASRRPGSTRVAMSASPRPRRRSWALAVIGVLVVGLCAVLFAESMAQAGDRKPVLAVVVPVAAGQPLTAADLQVVRVSASGPVSLLPAADEASVLGRPAAGPMPAGTLLTSGDLGPAAPAAGQDDLGVAVKAGQYPPDLTAGQTVDVLSTPASSSSSSPGSSSSPALPVGQAVVLNVSTSASSGTTVVELELSQNDVPQVAAAAATGQIALATIGAGR